MNRFIPLMAITLLVIPLVHAATIEGTAYTFDLSLAKGVVIEIDTAPRQQLVSLDGTYSLTVPAGSYRLSATTKENGIDTAKVIETITVTGEGTYTLDLILFPEFKDNEDLVSAVNTSGTEGIDDAQTGMTSWIVGIVVLIAGSSIAWWLVRKKNVKEAEPGQPSKIELDDLISAIKKLGGRTTQKELRKEIPYSEAKVSLMLTELEHAGKITKIKRGRANVIILK